ncbi:MAG: hypothetical protein GX813_02690 [Erysipelotrichia bacterium]|nr:hypothetical protein [Erysipelotrichia bacterium]
MSKTRPKKNKKPKSKLRKTIEWVFTGIFIALFLVVFAGQIDGMIHKGEHYNQDIRFGFATFIVETNSMEPDYKVDSAIITFLEDPQKIYERYQNGETIDLTFMDAYGANTPYTKPLKAENAHYTNKTQPTNVPMTHRLKEVLINENLIKGEGRYTFIVAGINLEGYASAANQYQAFTEKELLGRVIANSPILGGVFNFVSSPFGLLFLLLIPSFYLIITSVIDLFKAYKEPDELKVESVADQVDVTSSGRQLSAKDKKLLKDQLLQEMLAKKSGDKNEN